MGKQKQQTISRFFAPKPAASGAGDHPPSATSTSTLPPARKISATASFSPSKRKLLSQSLTPNKTPKFTPRVQTLTPSPSLHQRFLSRLLEPSDPNRTENQASCSVKYTPLEQQVVEIKSRYPDVILMVEVGYKYRFFGEDAAVASRVLGIYSHVDRSFLTASVPTFRLNVHVRRLVSEGYKVGVVKQTETAAIKAHGENRSGPFCRGLSALYTKATLEAAEGVGGKEEGCGGESSYLCCVVERRVGMEGVVDVRVGVVGVEISTGDVVYGEFDDGALRSGLEAFVLSLAPAELLLGDPLSSPTEKLLLAYAGPASNVRVERVSNRFSSGDALAEVVSLYEKIDEGISMSNDKEQMEDVSDQHDSKLAIEGIMKLPELAVQALALIAHHLKQFGFERILCLGASFRSFSSNTEMNLSANTLQQLEVLQNNSDGSESGSLLHVMNHTRTIYGSRLLRHWVTHPLCDRNMISARLDAVSEIAECIRSHKHSQSASELDEHSDVAVVLPDFHYVLSDVLTKLGRSPDIQRGITRIFHRTASTKEFIQVIQAILVAGKQLQRLHISEELDNSWVPSKTPQSPLLKRLISTASSAILISFVAKLLSAINKDAAEKGDLPNLLIASEGQFSEVASARTAVQVVENNLNSLIYIYRRQPGMRNVEFMSVSGDTHLIELPADFIVPSDWVKVNSTKKTIRYHPPEVLTALDQLSLANEQLMIVSRTAWDSFLRGFADHYAEFQCAVRALAALDCLHALATLSRNKNYVRPEFIQDDEPVQIHIRLGYHPVLETVLQDHFVPNDTELHSERESCQIVTGPNMGGKSCYIRQVALIALMAQVGSFVPASSAVLSVLDGIYTRMGVSDSIQRGRSTFLEELSEASHILYRCTSRSLVIIDELGRGTSTHDGGAIAYATLHHLLAQKQCLVLFVTHYPEIADIKCEFPVSVGAYHVSYLTSDKNSSSASSDFDGEDVTYLYKLVPGVSEKSFGFKVARMAQLPLSCIKRAIIMSARLEAALHSRIGNMEDRKQMVKSLISDGEKEQTSFIQSSDYLPTEMPRKIEELSNAYLEFFANLKLAFLDQEDPSECRQRLENARGLCSKLINY